MYFTSCGWQLFDLKTNDVPKHNIFTVSIQIIWMADVYLCLSIITFDQKVIEKYMVKRIGLSNNNSSSIALFIHLNVNISP
jgi:hypothetical protein